MIFNNPNSKCIAYRLFRFFFFFFHIFAIHTMRQKQNQRCVKNIVTSNDQQTVYLIQTNETFANCTQIQLFKGKKLKATKKTSDNAPLKKRTRRLRRYAALRETQLYGCCCYVSIKQYLILLYSFTALLCLARLSIVLCCVVNRKKRRKKLTK